MKNNSTPIPHSHKKIKPKPSTTSNNFSQKYFQFTKEKTFASTPKKTNHHTREIVSPRDSRDWKNQATSSKKKLDTPYGARSQKININMEIKNFNIYSTTTNQVSSAKDLKKKKLHKKTISCLNNIIQKQPSKLVPKQGKKPLKHAKTKSQQNMKVNPKQWCDLLTKYGKGKKQQDLVTKIAHCNRCGFCPEKKNKINQDSFIILQNFMKHGRYLFGVCDGHGINGHFVSEFVKQILPENIQYYFLKNKNMNKVVKSSIQSSLKQAFQKTSKDLLESGIDVMFSGSTTCLVYIQKHSLYCANLGDSRAVLFSRGPTQNAQQPQQWSYKQLSTDHKAQDKREAIRIEMNGGRVFPYRDQDGQQMGPFRVWVKQQNIPGLAMTRSFGDYVASTVGVIDQPEILQHQITKQNKFMVIASDGLWEFVSEQQVLNIVTPSFIRNDPQSAVKDLQNTAVEAWKREDESIDDITIIVVFFKYY